MNFLGQVAKDIHQITTGDFGQHITVTAPAGQPKTVTGFAARHSTLVDENGFLKVNATTAHISVTEKSLKDAGIATRDGAGKLITFEGMLVNWTDVSGMNKTYVVQKGGSKPNETVGLISFILGNYTP
jgi:hypothetical protein